MALPKLNDSPKYEVVVPSMKTNVRFRPYLVKEEKVLMMAMEAQDPKKALSAIVDTIDACVQDDLDSRKLTTFDVEYLFTQIRSKSVGETSRVQMPCSKCESPIELEIPLSEIKVEVPEDLSNTVKLTEDITLQLKWPSYTELLEMDIDMDDIGETFKMISKCIEYVQTPEENINLKDESEEEIQAFIDQLTTEQFGYLRDWIEQMPRLEHKVDICCTQCGHKEERILAGINNFF